MQKIDTHRKLSFKEIVDYYELEIGYISGQMS